MADKKRVNIRQVAEEAGVSTQTVSRVINDRPDVAPETRQRVQQVIDQLGYQPSYLARSLTQGRSCTLGVVGYGLEYYGPSRTLSGIEQQANELGFTLLLSLVRQPEDYDVERHLRDLVSRHVDGIIWAVPAIGNNRARLQHKNPPLRLPMIFIDSQPGSNLPAVGIDGRAGGRLATEHLLAQGYRHIGLITGPLTWETARQRKLGWQDALLTVRSNQIFEGNWSADSGEGGLHQLLAQYPEMDALFACNDQMALGAMHAAHQLGLRIPEDLAVVGFDNMPESAHFWPPLTTVQQQLIEQGRTAVRELSRMMEAMQEDEKGAQTRVIWLQPEVIIRKSSVVS